MFEIIMSGIVSKNSILLLENGLKRHCDSAMSLDFFCLYSEYEIPIGAAFSIFRNLETGSSIKIKARLVDITQQWGISYDRIPIGHRTPPPLLVLSPTTWNDNLYFYLDVSPAIVSVVAMGVRKIGFAAKTPFLRRGAMDCEVAGMCHFIAVEDTP